MNNGINVRSLLMTSFAFVAVFALMSPAYAQTFTTYQTPQACGNTDIMIVLDVTGSMGGAIENIKAGAAAIITQAQNNLIAGAVLRVGLITYGPTNPDPDELPNSESVSVLHPLTTDIASVLLTLSGLTAGGGEGDAEASDMAKQIAVQATDLLPDVTVDSDGVIGTVVGSNNVEWDQTLNSVRLIVIDGDQPSGGYNDVSSMADRDNFVAQGAAAAAKGIQVLDVYIDHGFSDDDMIALMEADAAASAGGGGFENAGACQALDGSDCSFGQDIIDFLADPAFCDPCLIDPELEQCQPIVGGEFSAIDNTALLIAGMSANLGLIVPIVAGIAGASAYFIKTRMNKE